MSEAVNQQVADAQKILGEIDKYTTNLAGDLDFVVQQNQELIGKLEAGDANVTEQLRAINTALAERAENLRALASRVDQPVPPPSATPIESITSPAQVAPVEEEQPAQDGQPANRATVEERKTR